MTFRQAILRRTFVPLWIVACAVSWELGWNVGVAVNVLLGFAAVGSYRSLVMSTLVGGAMLGLCLGVAHWILLRRRFTGPVAWIIPATLLGAAVGRFAAAHTLLFVHGVASDVTGGALLGFAIGVAQWVALRGYLTRSKWWVAASTASLALGVPIQFAAFDAGLAFPYAIAGALYGLATGILLLLPRLPGRVAMTEEDVVARLRI